jgi:pyruvate,water dikinase
MTTTAAPSTKGISAPSDKKARDARRFPDPYEIPAPPGAEGWEDLYAYHNRFLPARRGEDGAKTWFRNSMHFPEPSFPFDQVAIDGPFTSTGVMNTRVFALPPAKGMDVRVINGATYMCAIGVNDPEELQRRGQEFGKRAGHYYQNWDSLYEKWVGKVTGAIKALRDIKVPPMAEFEPSEDVLDARGITQGNDLVSAYHRLIESIDQIWSLHSEFLNLGYAAYLQFLMLCKENFPEIDDQTVARMVSGVDVLLFRPDDELRALARLAREYGIAREVAKARSEADLISQLKGSEKGNAWLAAFNAAKDPWFYFSYGSGFYHHHRSWIDDPSVPIRFIGDYIARLDKGDELTRPIDKLIAERDEIVARYRSLLDPDVTQRFDEALGLSRKVFPYVENHNFYIEHWFMTDFWNKAREFSSLFVRWEFWGDVEDFFYLRRAEVEEAVVDLHMAWAAGGKPQGPFHWPEIIAKRKKTYKALAEWAPPPALGPMPKEVNEPLTIMLWGITAETVDRWIEAQGSDKGMSELKGFAGSPGIAEGRARVILSPDRLGELEEGEILVAPITSPSWTPVFGRIRAAVSDIGGIMCHAAIVSREYGLPAVVGTGFGTSTIKTGQLIRVDGDTGKVHILEG